MSTNRDQIDNITRSSLCNSRGIELAERGWLDEAIIQFKRAIAMTPNDCEGYDNLATVYADKGELLQALVSYVKALNLDPENTCALHNLGCFLSNHANQLAMSCFKSAYRLEPDFYESRFNLGLILASEEKHEQAISHFEAALSLSDNDPEIRYNLALSLIELNFNARAIRELNEVVREQEQNDAAWYQLGHCYHLQGFIEQAEASYVKAIKMNPKNIEAILGLASLLKSKKCHREARTWAKRAIKLDKKQALDAIALDEYLCKEQF